MTINKIRMAITTVAAALALLSLPALAVSIDVKIQVRAVDAKFIGSGVGAMNVVIENAQTGALLANGQITGATGDTAALMKEGQTRGYSPATPDSASFTASIDIDRPVLARIRIHGPLAVPQSIRELSVTQWLIPGQDLVEPGIVLHLPGLIVAPVDVAVIDGELQVQVDVSMLCGCPITKDGLWDSDDFSVTASLYREGEMVQAFALEFIGNTNRFAGKVKVPETGSYELWIAAHESKANNTGAWYQQLDL